MKLVVTNFMQNKNLITNVDDRWKKNLLEKLCLE